MKEKYLPNKKYYEFSTQGYCGVVTDEKTMKKIQKVLYAAEHEIKNILHNAEDVRPYSWGMVYEKEAGKIKGEVIYYHYPDFGEYKKATDRINNLKLAGPIYKDSFYEINSEQERSDLEALLLKEVVEINKSKEKANA